MYAIIVDLVIFYCAENFSYHSSVLSSLQFKRLLNRELHHFSGTSHAGSEISEYICNTFLGTHSTFHMVYRFYGSLCGVLLTLL